VVRRQADERAACRADQEGQRADHPALGLEQVAQLRVGDQQGGRQGGQHAGQQQAPARDDAPAGFAERHERGEGCEQQHRRVGGIEAK
jgi:hypothetical protein